MGPDEIPTGDPDDQGPGVLGAYQAILRKLKTAGAGNENDPVKAWSNLVTPSSDIALPLQTPASTWRASVADATTPDPTKTANADAPDSPGPVPVDVGTKPKAVSSPTDFFDRSGMTLGGPPVKPQREAVAGGLGGSSLEGANKDDLNDRIRGLMDMARAGSMSPSQLFAKIGVSGTSAGASLDNNGMSDPSRTASIDAAVDKSPADLTKEFGYKGPALTDRGGFVEATKPAYMPPSVGLEALATDAAMERHAKAVAAAQDPLGLTKTLAPEIVRQAGELNKIDFQHRLANMDQNELTNALQQVNQSEQDGIQSLRQAWQAKHPDALAPRLSTDPKVRDIQQRAQATVQGFKQQIDAKRQAILSAHMKLTGRENLSQPQGAGPML